MNLTSHLSPGTVWVLRGAVLVAIALGVFSTQCSTKNSRSAIDKYNLNRTVGSCSLDAYTNINLRDGAQAYRDALLKCLQKNDLTFEELGMPLSGLLSRLPANPEQYFGNWISRRANCEYRVTLEATGYYNAEPVLCESNKGSEQGIWAVLDGNMVWIPVPSTPRQVVTNAINNIDNNNFVVSEKDGSSTLFSKAGGVQPSLAVDSTIRIIPPDEKGEIASQMVAANMDQTDPATLPDAKPISISGSSEALWQRSLDGAIMRWDPATGLLKALPVRPVARNVHLTAAATDSGLMLFKTLVDDLNPMRTEVLLLSADDNVVSRGNLKVPRIDATLVTLADQSVLAVGGTVSQRRTDYDNRKKTRTNVVERVTWSNDRLQVAEIAPLPGDTRHDYAVVALNDGRAMLIGGGSSSTGQEMSDETLFLDVTANTWEAGPKMLEPRSGASATMLSNGNVLVAGGWTPGNGWDDGASRSTEIWDQHSNSFSSGARLPIGVANHQAKWVESSQRNALLLVGGWMGAWSESPIVTIYDVDRGVWVTAIDQCVAAQKSTGMAAIPFEFNGDSLLWCQSTKSMQMPWRLVSLERNAAGSIRIDSAEGIALGRSGIGFVPPGGPSPGLAAGGNYDGFDSAAVDVVWRDGRLLSIAPLNHARRYAQVFRRKDGSFLVAGGLAGSSGRRTEHVPPLELLPAGQPLASARWQEIDFPMSNVDGVGLLSDDSLLVVHSSGKVERLIITSPDGIPVVERIAFPSLNRKRGTSRRTYDREIVVRELTDGRIIVAGGNVQHHRMALLHEEVFTYGAADQIVGVGEFSAARFYEIYDPDLGDWTESVSSKGAGWTMAILDDGRVITWGELQDSDYWEQVSRYSFDDDESQTLLEVSSADGKSWRQVETSLPSQVVLNTVRESPELFVIDNELFLFGRQAADNGSRVSMVQWFDADGDGWVTLWQSGPKDNWYRNHLGRTIIRDLPNGKRVVLPVAGLSGRGSGG